MNPTAPSTGVRQVFAVTCAYLLFASVILLLFLAASRITLAWYVAVAAALPLVLYLVISASSRHDPQQLLAKSTGCFLFFPALLLACALSLEPPSGPFEPSAPVPVDTRADLDQARLFAGALAVQDVPLQSAGVLRMRSAAFADGTELRLTRFADADLARRQLEQWASALYGKNALLGGRSGVRIAPSAVGSLLVFFELHGRDVLELRASNEQLMLGRIAAQAIPAPPTRTTPAQAAVVTQPVRSVWPFAVGYCLGHVLMFCGFILWAAPTTTRVAPAAGTELASPSELAARLFSLNHTGAPCTVSSGTTAQQIFVDYRFDHDRRAHRLSLTLDPARRLVRVREILGAYGDKPRNAEEADMRVDRIGFDPTRPAARRIWGKSRQTTPVHPNHLAAVPMAIQDSKVTLPANFARELDPEQMVHLACAIVTHSGYTWQPVLFSLSA